MFLGQRFDLGLLTKDVDLFQQSLLVDLASQLLAQVHVIWIRYHSDRFEQLINIDGFVATMKL